MIGRDMAESSGYLFSYSAFAFSALGEELLDVLLAHVLHDGLDRADVERLLAHELEVLALLADVDGERDDVEVLLLGEPLDGDGGVEPAGVCEYALVLAHCACLSFRAGRLHALSGGRGTCRWSTSCSASAATSCAMTRIVSSPAMQPRTSGSSARVERCRDTRRRARSTP